MADETKDQEIDPLAGMLTPQSLYMMRLQQLQQSMNQAGQLDGMGYGARMAGLTIGNALGQAQGRDPLSPLANFNSQMLANTPMPGAGGAGDARAVNAGLTGADGAPAVSPLEAQAQVWDQRAQITAASGQYQTAQMMTAQANRLRKADEDLKKTREDAFMAHSKGLDALANRNDVKVTQNPDGTFSYASLPKEGGAATPITGAAAPPPMPVASVDLRGALPGFDRTLDMMKTYKLAADQATIGLSRVNQMQNLLDSGQIITGPGADFRLGVSNALVSMGLASSKDPVVNTTSLLNLAKQNALALRPPSMQRLTNADLTYLDQMAGGKIEWNKDSLKRVNEINRRTFQAAIDTYSNQKKAALKATYEPGLDKNVAASMRAGINSMGDPGAVPQAPAGQNGPPEVTSQEQYEALGDHAAYMSNGKLHYKNGKQ